MKRHKWIVDQTDLATYIKIRCEKCEKRERLKFTTINFFEYVLLPYLESPGKLTETGKEAIKNFVTERKGILKGINADLAREIRKLEKTGKNQKRMAKLKKMKRLAEVAPLFFKDVSQ